MHAHDPVPADSLALLVLDIQDRLIAAIPDKEGFLQRARYAVSMAGILGIPVTITEQSPDKLGPTHPGISEASRPAARVFPKTQFNAFANEEIRQALTVESGPRHLLIAGLETPICVYQTALGAQEQGLEVTILADCVAGRRPEDSAGALQMLRESGIYVLPSETVFFSLLGSADHPAFRDVARLTREATEWNPSPPNGSPS